MNNGDKIKGAVREMVEKYPQIKVVYLFGSKANETAGPMSDFDIAVYVDEHDKKKRFDIKLDIETALARELMTDKIDVVILNDTRSPELKFNIISKGIVIYEEEPYKVLIEPRILNEFFDFRQTLRQFGLTKA